MIQRKIRKKDLKSTLEKRIPNIPNIHIAQYHQFLEKGIKTMRYHYTPIRIVTMKQIGNCQ